MTPTPKSERTARQPATDNELDDILDWQNHAIMEVILEDAKFGNKIEVTPELVEKHKTIAKEKLEAFMQRRTIQALEQALPEKWPEHSDMTNVEQSPTPNWIFGYNTAIDDMVSALKSSNTESDPYTKTT